MSSYSDGSDEPPSEQPPSELDDLKLTLLQHLSQVHSAGSFATFDTIQDFVHPGISVDPIGTVRLPLSEVDAHALIQASQQAPFGKGVETLVDRSVRNTWQIDAGKVRFLNKRWQTCLDRIVKKVAEELGIAGGSRNVRAEFYKMLLYEKGATFKAHKDTEKAPGMFGTLVICLPSEHTGGGVCLEHGTKKVHFDTSESSAWDATCVAWYADVTHEIEPVQTGYRWVLTYNLINDFKSSDQSAICLAARIELFTQVLTQWQGLECPLQFLAYALEHQYTNEGLRLAQLKGDDYYRAIHIAQSCAEHRGFHVLLANLEVSITKPNDEGGENEKAVRVYLRHIVDLKGFSLLIHHSLTIPETYLVQGLDDERDPDTQRGGEYMGNQHAHIDQIFSDSVLILVPNNFIASFLLGRGFSPHHLRELIQRLRKHIKEQADDTTSQKLLLQICQSSLSTKYNSDGQKDLSLGPVAVAAAFMRDDALFAKAIEQSAGGFDGESYYALGELICLRDLDVSEDDIIEALMRSRKLHDIYSNLNSFSHGFSRGNPNRGDQIEAAHQNRWIDHIVCKALGECTEAYAEDAIALIDIILDCDNTFMQFVRYQGVRGFVDRFLHSKILTNALMVELLLHLPDSGSAGKFLEKLLQRITETAISDFELQLYAIYVKSRASPGFKRSAQKDGGRRPKAWGPLAGPAKSLYGLVCAHDGGKPSRLLGPIQTQAPELSNQQLEEILMPMLEELLTVVDPSSSESQECVQTLLTTYIARTVGKEPERPTDWARPEEVGRRCSEVCNDCLAMETFMRDREMETFKLPYPKEKRWHVERNFHHFETLEVEKVDYLPVAVTKTTKRWGELHQEWMKRASGALVALRKLPQTELKECLVERYDEIMELRMVKVDDDGSHTADRPSKKARTS